MKDYPNVLLIGGMKCGSTMLYDVFRSCPEVFCPQNKEPSFLKLNSWDQMKTRLAYKNLYLHANEDQLRLDASTRYTMRNTNRHPADKARQWFGSNLKIIYIVRTPVARIISHYVHSKDGHDMEGTFSEALKHDERLINFSRYFWQLEPWAHAFGMDQCFVLTLDAYTRNSEKLYGQLRDFLGLPPRDAPPLTRVNEASNRIVLPPLITKNLRRYCSSRIYSKFDRRFTKMGRRFLIGLFGRKGMDPASINPNAEEIKWIWEQLISDYIQLAPHCQGDLEDKYTIWTVPKC